MGENDYLFYTYTGNWDANTLPYTSNYPNSIVLHPQTKRLMHDGIIYGSGEGGPYFIKGNNASGDTTGKWTGSHTSITKYEDGLTLIFVPNVAGNNTKTTLNVNNLGERDIYFNDTILTKQYSVGTPILLTYIGDENNGTWKRADSDILQTPINSMATNTDYYITFSKGLTGLQDLYVLNLLKYNFNSQTLYSPNFSGKFHGDLEGNATSASKLKDSVTLWSQSFDGSSNVKGDIKNTGTILPETNNESNIGKSTLFYNIVFGKFFRGRADGLAVTQTNNKTIYLIGQESSEINKTDGEGPTYSNRYLYYNSSDNYLYTPRIVTGSSSSFESQYRFKVTGNSLMDGTTEITNNLYVDGNLGIGTNSPSQKFHVVGNAKITGNITADKFIKDGGTNNQVLLADGTTKNWDTANGTQTIVARDNSGDIYGHKYFSNINDDDTLTIGSVYISTGSSDKAISKVSIAKFMNTIDASNVISITKNLKVTRDWMDTGITSELSNFPQGNGTYVIQIDATAISNSTDLWPSLYSGVITIYNGTNNTSETEEVILHRAGHATAKRLYIRTQPTLNTGGKYSKIQIASSSDFSQAYDIIFKFKKII